MMPAKFSVDVVVIGAGLSGLEAARLVQQAGLSVAVLEARDRVGGKTWSITAAGNSKADVGAAWINDSNQSRMYGMVKRFGLEVVKQNTVGDCVLYSDDKAQRFPHGETPPFPGDGKEQVLALRDLIETLSTGLDLHRPTNGDHDSMVQYDRETVEEFVKREGLGKAAQDAVKVWTRVMFGLEPSDISALYFLWYCRAGGGLLIMRGEKEHGGQYLRIKKGTQSFSQHLAAGLKPGTVHLNTAAKQICQSKTGVTIQTEGGVEFACKRTIITVPSPSYAWMTFEPPLPEPKRILSQRARFGHTMKVILVYSKPWWREFFLCGFAQSSKGPISICRDSSVDNDGQFSLTCFVTAEPGKRWIKLEPKARESAVLDQVANMFGPACASKTGVAATKDEIMDVARQPLEMFYHDWTADVWSQGCPCPVLPPGPNGVLDLASALDASVGYLHFAGTETSNVWRGYMEGAVRAGERAAEEVIGVLAKSGIAKL